MSNTYAADARSVYADLREDGGPIVFTVQLTAPVHDPATGTVTPGTTGPLPTRALQLEDDPEELVQLANQGIVLVDPVKVMVASLSDGGQPWRPAKNMLFVWGGDPCVVKSFEAQEPDGETPIYYTVFGDRGPDQ